MSLFDNDQCYMIWDKANIFKKLKSRTKNDLYKIVFFSHLWFTLNRKIRTWSYFYVKVHVRKIVTGNEE